MITRLVRHLHYRFADFRRVRSAWITCPARDLDAHESVGHTIARHIRISPDDLAHRLQTEGRRAVSAFWDSAVAAASINYAVAAEFDQLADWFFGSAEKRLRLDVLTPGRATIGYGLLADDPRMRFSREVRVVFERFDDKLFIRTAFPRVSE